MRTHTKIENILISKIDVILSDYQDYEKPYLNKNGDIVIQKKTTQIKSKNTSMLTSIFKEIIKNDEKKTGFKTLFRI